MQRINPRRPCALAVRVLLIAWALVLDPSWSWAMIEFGEGNTPLQDPGWPAGAAAIVNRPERVDWWSGPLGHFGQTHAEYRGDATALSEVLRQFAAIPVDDKRVFVYDGPGYALSRDPNAAPAKPDERQIDYTFVVWDTASWQQERERKNSFAKTEQMEKSPPARVEVYAGDRLKWSDVKIPAELTIIDQRLVAHGFSPADGMVVEATLSDQATGRPLTGQMRVERIDSQTAGETRTSLVAEGTADSEGHCVLKQVPAGWLRVVLAAEGYVPRIVEQKQFSGKPCWQAYTAGLSPPVELQGSVTDEAGAPLTGAEVRIIEIASDDHQPYSTPDNRQVTDAEGKFHFEGLPSGSGRLRARKDGYTTVGLSPKVKLPNGQLQLKMSKAATLQVTVDFGGASPPPAYQVNIDAEAGAQVGSWGGSANIDAQNQCTFTAIPPGRYLLYGRPNPGSDNQQTPKVAVELKGGEEATLTLKAK